MDVCSVGSGLHYLHTFITYFAYSVLCSPLGEGGTECSHPPYVILGMRIKCAQRCE